MYGFQNTGRKSAEIAVEQAGYPKFVSHAWLDCALSGKTSNEVDD